MIRLLAPLALALALLPFRPAPAAEPEAPGQDAEARRLFNDVLKAYKALDAYADRGTFAIEMKVDGKPGREARPMSLVFARPDKIALDTGDVRLLGDGGTLATVIVPDKKYMVAKSATPAPALLLEGPLGAMLRGGPAGPAASPLLSASLLLNLLVGEDPGAAILENTKTLRADPDAPVDGHPARVLRLEQERGPALRLFVDPARKLLVRVELVVTPADLEAKVPGVTLSDASIAWNSGPISTTPLPPESFAFKKPDGFTEVAPIELGKKPAGGAAAEPEHALVGKPAPDFTLTVLDGPGKTKKVTNADLAGKVVLIDFWATWCGPCMLELPEVAKLVDAYAKAKKDVVVMAISQDSDPEDLKEVRKLVEAKLAEEGIDLQKGDVGKIALDPTHAVGNAFGVQGIPMVVILDAKGVVQSVHVGFRPEVGELLTSDVDTLLEGKSLVTPKVDAAAKPAAKP